MAYPKSTPTSWVVKSVATAGKKSVDLLPGEFGIFDSDTHLTLAPSAVKSKRRVYMGVGSFNALPGTVGGKLDRIANPGNTDITFRSEPVSPKLVDIIRLSVPKRSEKPNEYYLGYNGIDVCESLNFKCGRTYKFHVQLMGRPVRELFGHEMSEIIEVTTGCCDDCDTSCNNAEPCEKYVDELIKNFNDSLWVGKFFTAEKVIHCSPDLPSLTKTSFTTYCLTVCDNGDELALAAVQAQYPTVKVSVKQRLAPSTTYQFTQLTATAAPAAFTQSNVTLQNCATCPSGYTAAAAGYAYIVQIDNANPAAGSATLTAVQAVWATVTSATLVEFKNGTATYYVVSSAALVSAASGVDATLLQPLGTVPARCTLTTPVSTAWVSCNVEYKLQRDLCVTVKVDDCDTDFDGADAGETLARLTAMLATVPDYVPASVVVDADSTDCLLRYTVSQYSNNLMKDGCDTIPAARFDPFPTFEGQEFTVCPCEGWTVDVETGCPVPPVPTDRCCQCGVKFVGKPLRNNPAFCGYDINEYLEKEPIRMVVSAYNYDNETNVCTFDSPTWFQTQKATYRQLRGDDVIKSIIMEKHYNQEIYANPIDKFNILLMRQEGIRFGVNLDEYYYAVDVYHNSPNVVNNTASYNNPREQVTLYVSEKDLATVDALKANLVTSFPEAATENFA